jgi:hypothetical protein
MFYFLRTSKTMAAKKKTPSKANVRTQQRTVCPPNFQLPSFTVTPALKDAAAAYSKAFYEFMDDAALAYKGRIPEVSIKLATNAEAEQLLSLDAVLVTEHSTLNLDTHAIIRANCFLEQCQTQLASAQGTPKAHLSDFRQAKRQAKKITSLIETAWKSDWLTCANHESNLDRLAQLRSAFRQKHTVLISECGKLRAALVSFLTPPPGAPPLILDLPCSNEPLCLPSEILLGGKLIFLANQISKGPLRLNLGEDAALFEHLTRHTMELHENPPWKTISIYPDNDHFQQDFEEEAYGVLKELKFFLTEFRKILQPEVIPVTETLSKKQSSVNPAIQPNKKDALPPSPATMIADIDATITIKVRKEDQHYVFVVGAHQLLYGDKSPAYRFLWFLHTRSQKRGEINASNKEYADFLYSPDLGTKHQEPKPPQNQNGAFPSSFVSSAIRSLENLLGNGIELESKRQGGRFIIENLCFKLAE